MTLQNNNQNDNIFIIIQGQEFATTRSLLSKYSEYFENLFDEYKDIKNEIKNEITIENQEPIVFAHVLKSFNDLSYVIPEEFSEKCKFYLLKYNQIYNECENNLKELCRSKRSIEYDISRYEKAC